MYRQDRKNKILNTILSFKYVIQIIGVIALSILITTIAAATTIDFDSIDASGGLVPVSNQFQSSGVLFSSTSGADANAATTSEASSPANILIGVDAFSDIFVSFVDQTSGLSDLDHVADNVSVDIISLGHSEWTIITKDLADQTLETIVLSNPGGTLHGTNNINSITFSSFNIASIDFVFTSSAPGDGVGIDNLSFTLGAPEPVPKPTTIALLGIGLAGLAGAEIRCRRRKKASQI